MLFCFGLLFVFNTLASTTHRQSPIFCLLLFCFGPSIIMTRRCNSLFVVVFFLSVFGWKPHSFDCHFSMGQINLISHNSFIVSVKALSYSLYSSMALTNFNAFIIGIDGLKATLVVSIFFWFSNKRQSMNNECSRSMAMNTVKNECTPIICTVHRSDK